jgi:hypothetical protein
MRPVPKARRIAAEVVSAGTYHSGTIATAPVAKWRKAQGSGGLDANLKPNFQDWLRMAFVTASNV